MNSLKQTIVNAVLRVIADPQYKDRDYSTPQEARDDFVKALIAELFPESPEMPNPTAVEVPTLPASPKEKKKPGRKPKAAAKPAEPVAEEKPAEPVAEEKPAEPAEPAKPVKQRAKPGPKPKVKPEGPVNLEKLNPTHSKKLKAANVEDKKAFLAYANGLTAEEYGSKTFEDHIKNYLDSLAPAAAVPDTPKTLVAEVETIEVEFNGETYYVDPATKKVYKEEGTVSVHVGDVGLAKFADMKIPDDV